MTDIPAPLPSIVKSKSIGRIRLAFHQDADSYWQAISKGIELCPKYRELSITMNARIKTILIESNTPGLEDDFMKTLMSYGLIRIGPNKITNRPSKALLNRIKTMYKRIDDILLQSTGGSIDLPIVSAFTLCILGSQQISRNKFLPAGMPLFINALHILQDDSVKKS
jgi:hypothetical protein